MTSSLIAATGIASVWSWDPARLRTAAEDLDTAFPGRFILGLGVSHAPIVEALRERVQAHLDTGADHVVIQPLDAGAFAAPALAALAALAETVADFLKR